MGIIPNAMKTSQFDRDHLAVRIRYAREARFMTQAQLAEKTGMQSAAISHFETGERTPSIPNIIRLCRGLGVSPNQLLCDYLEI